MTFAFLESQPAVFSRQMWTPRGVHQAPVVVLADILAVILVATLGRRGEVVNDHLSTRTTVSINCGNRLPCTEGTWTTKIQADLNATPHECVAEAFDTAHNIVILLYPRQQLTWSTIIMPAILRTARGGALLSTTRG